MPGMLTDKVAVITGGGRGIGRSVALAFAEQGARLVINDLGTSLEGVGRSTAEVDSVVEEVRAGGGRATPSYDSVASMEGGRKVVQAAIDSFGRVDVLVTAAGIIRNRMVYNMTEEEWDSVIAAHLKGTFAVAKAACGYFREQGGGRIITISSEAGLVGNPAQASYGAAKAGIAGFTKAVAREMDGYGVTANCLVPRAHTRASEGLPEAMAQFRAMGIAGLDSDTDRIAEFLPEDIAPMFVYLASDEAAHINGQVFLAYGGHIALFRPPEPARTIYSDRPWTIDSLERTVPERLVLDVTNPAPPQPNGNGRPAAYGPLNSSVAIVDGAGGHGRSVAATLAREGVRVVINDPDTALADAACQAIRTAGGDAIALHEDAATIDGAERMVQSALERFQRADIVVSAPTGEPASTLADATEEEWDFGIEGRLRSTFALIKAAGLHFRQQRGGRIIALASGDGPASAAAASEAIVGLTRVAARDLGRYAVTVNCVFSGDGDALGPFVSWLASDASSDVNGQLFSVQGNTVTLIRQPSEAQALVKDGRWTAEEIADLLPRTLRLV